MVHWTTFTPVLVMLAVSVGQAEVVLFDGNLGTTPNAQGWAFLTDPFLGHSVSQAASTGFVTLDTRAPITDRGGYFSRDPVFGVVTHPRMPVIDRQAGFAIDLSLRLNAESHTTGPSGDDNGDGLEDRAGFAWIVISSDMTGIELGLWEDRIWAQDDDAISPTALFTQAEGTAFDTSTEMVDYQLRVLGNAYQLVREGGVAPVLGGRLRDYRNFTGSLDPYELPNFLFFGDNTTRGESLSQIGRIAADELPSPCQDADALVAAVIGGQNPPAFDINGDGHVDPVDLGAWLAVAGAFRLGPGRAYLPGDANLDGVVDGSDFGIWNSHKFQPTTGWCAGDFNADGFADGSDFGIWNSHKFTTSLDITSVPEPSSVAIGLSLELCRQAFRRVRRRKP